MAGSHRWDVIEPAAVWVDHRTISLGVEKVGVLRLPQIFNPGWMNPVLV
jgi:hypothetical protein